MTAQDNTFDAEFDVVVVGSGVAALFGAATAAARGLSTCLIEKTDRFGGTSAYSGGAEVSGRWPLYLREAGGQDSESYPGKVENPQSFLCILGTPH